MMTSDEAAARKSEVIESFLRDGLDADPARVRLWVSRHPECRAELLEVASRLAVATLVGEGREIEAAERAEIRARAVARARALSDAEDGNGTFDALLAAAGLDVPELARRIDMPREELAEIEAGHVELPLPGLFLDLVARTLGRSAATVASALALQGPAPMHAKGTGEVTLGRVTWRELIEESDMSDERKAFWLDEA